jgi:hypothetical protein
MDPEALKAFFRIGVFIGVCSLVMLVYHPVGSGEWVVSFCSTLVGGAMVLLVVLFARYDPVEWLARHAPKRAPQDDDEFRAPDTPAPRDE